MNSLTLNKMVYELYSISVCIGMYDNIYHNYTYHVIVVMKYTCMTIWGHPNKIHKVDANDCHLDSY